MRQKEIYATIIYLKITLDSSWLELARALSYDFIKLREYYEDADFKCCRTKDMTDFGIECCRMINTTGLWN
ncbi:hypothetical protein RCL_jg1242.t1 [Rhizophagus clarus]|uniref:Uncharacterized protein n=1 Tax=Rhizophagus clarus TaxID=94130 RepID=A0A8H3L443_9GLOM|nr:hypothetical protein RCL_jg1242.t1 [Rhizophagus clarus]